MGREKVRKNVPKLKEFLNILKNYRLGDLKDFFLLRDPSVSISLISTDQHNQRKIKMVTKKKVSCTTGYFR